MAARGREEASGGGRAEARRGALMWKPQLHRSHSSIDSLPSPEQQISHSSMPGLGGSYAITSSGSPALDVSPLASSTSSAPEAPPIALRRDMRLPPDDCGSAACSTAASAAAPIVGPAAAAPAASAPSLGAPAAATAAAAAASSPAGAAAGASGAFFFCSSQGRRSAWYCFLSAPETCCAEALWMLMFSVTSIHRRSAHTRS